MGHKLYCHECGKSYDIDQLISIDDDKDIYECNYCGYENLYI
mgnify:CR=1 FL=1